MKIKVNRKGLLSDVIDLLPALSEDSEGMLSGGFLGVSVSSRTSDKNETCANGKCDNENCTNDVCSNSICTNKICSNGSCTNNICPTATTTTAAPSANLIF